MIEQISTVIIDADTQSIELLELYLKELDYIQIVESFSNAQTGCKKILDLKPSFAIINIAQNDEETLKTINKISLENKECKIIAISSDSSADTIVKTLRAGASEFIQKPLIKEELFSALNKIKDQIFGITSESKKCKVITTFSNKGGIGKTTIATNLALEIANTTKEKVALIDLNLLMGDVTTFLDVNPPFDISYVIKNIKNINEGFLLSTLEQYKDTSLYILADPPFMNDAEDVSAEQISKLIEALKQTFSYIIIDTSANFDAKTITALDNSDLIFLITILNLPAIRSCQRCLDLFKRLGYEKEKTKIIINRYMENDEIKVEDVEKVLNEKVYWKIPNNYFTIMSSINNGLPVSEVNSESNVAQSYRDLAAMLSDNIHKQNFAKKISRKPFTNFSNLLK